MKKEKVMIIGAGDFQVPLIEYAAKIYDVVLVAPVIKESLQRLVFSSYLLDVRAMDDILEIARAENIDGVITDQTDIPVRTVAYVAENLGLPGIGYETSCLFTDKVRMALKLEEIGIRPIPSARTASVEEAVSFMNELGGQVLIKPSDTQGSRGIYICNNEEELRAVYDTSKNFSFSDTVIAQKYIRGREFFVEGLAYEGSFRNLIIGDTNYFTSEKSFSAKERIVPPKDDGSDIVKKVLDVNLRILEGFGLKQGISHSEFIVEGEDVYLIETAARGGGVFISSDLISIASGLCTEEFLLNICLGKQAKAPELNPTGKACGYMAFYLPAGKVTNTACIDEVKALPYVHRHQLDNITEGMIHDQSPSDKTSRFALILSADNLTELKLRYNRVKELLNIVVETPDGLRGPIWD